MRDMAYPDFWAGFILPVSSLYPSVSVWGIAGNDRTNHGNISVIVGRLAARAGERQSFVINVLIEFRDELRIDPRCGLRAVP